MKRFIPLLALLYLWACPPRSAAQNTVTVTASKIYSAPPSSATNPPQLLSAGTAVFQATDALGNPIAYQLGGGGTVVNVPTVCTVKNGALTPTCTLANTATATPANFCYQLTIKNSANQVILGGRGSGYQCLQPTVTNTWCSGAVCNLDNYQPTVPQQEFTLAPPTATTLGGIYNTLCTFGLVVNGYNSTGQPNCVSASSSGGAQWGAITGTLSSQADLQNALNAKAPTFSPVFSGTPVAPTPGIGDNSNALATTAYVNNFPLIWGHLTGNLSNQADLWNFISVLAPLNSPAFTGTPTAPLQSLGDASLALATDQWVKALAYAPINSPTFTGSPTAPTVATNDSSTAIATTAWVNAQGYSAGTGNVVGPGTSTNNGVALFSGTNGRLLADAGFGFPLDKSHIGTFAPGSNGLVQSAFTDTTNAGNISSGTLAAARLPFPGPSTLGGVNSYTAIPQQFLTSISTGGAPAGRALVSADIPNNAANTSGNATTATNLAGAVLLPNGTTAVTQGTGDSSAELATDAFVLNNAIPGVTPGQGLALTGRTIGIAPCSSGQLQQSTGTGWACAASPTVPSPQYQLGYFSSPGTAAAISGNSRITTDVSGNLTLTGPMLSANAVSVSALATNVPTDTGAANAYVACPSAAPASLTAGQFAHFIATNGNTGASTLNWCSFGVSNLTFNGTGALVAGAINSGAAVEAQWDGTRWQCLNCETPGLNQINSPGASVITHIATWNDSTGTSLADSGFAFPLANAQLANSSVTVNGTVFNLGDSHTISAAPNGSAGGDLSGTFPNPTVGGVNGVPLCTGFTPTNGQVLQYTTAGSPNPCYTAAANGNFTNPMTLLGQVIYGGASGAATALNAPTTPIGVVYTLASVPSGGAAVPQWLAPGVQGRSVTSTSDTLTSADCNPNWVVFTGTSAATEFIPTPTTLGVTACTLRIANNTSQTLKLCAGFTGGTCSTGSTGWTISLGSGGSASSSVSIPAGEEATLIVDPKTSSNWSANATEQGLIAGTNITFTRGPTGLTIGANGTVTTTGSPANGNLAAFSGTGSITNTDLTGDCTTSGTVATTCAQLGANFTVNHSTGAVTTLGGNALVNNGVGSEIYSTNNMGFTGATGPNTILATSPAAPTYFRISFYVEQNALGSGCGGNTVIALLVGFQGPNEASASNKPVGSCAVVGNGVAGKGANCGGSTLGQASGSYIFPVKASTAITFSTTYTAGGGCSVNPTYNVTPFLEQM